MEALLLSLVQERNARETIPFVEIHASNEQLSCQVREWKRKCEDLERKLVLAREYYVNGSSSSNGNHNQEYDKESGSSSSTSNHNPQRQQQPQQHQVVSRSESAALKNERKLREEMERLQDQVKQQGEEHEQDTQTIRDLTKERDDFQSLHQAQEKTLAQMQHENDRQNRALDHLTTQNSDNQQRANLAEQQYSGLKDAIRTLQEENDSLKKENRQLESRLVSEKERLSSEMNILTDMVERLKVQAEMAKALQKQEEDRKSSSSTGSSWFGTRSSSSTALPSQPTTITAPAVAGSPYRDPLDASAAASSQNSPSTTATHEYPPRVAAILPSKPKHVISAHYKEAACIR